MQHMFDVDIAEQYGLAEAVFVHRIYILVLANEANGRNEHDGRFWTYDSAAAIRKNCPYWSIRSIEGLIKRCREKGLIETAQWSDNPRDRTNWYTVTDRVRAIYENRGMDSTENGNGDTQNVECTFHEKRECIKGTKTDQRKTAIQEKPAVAQIMERYNELCPHLPRCIKLTDVRRRAVKRLFERGYSTEQLETAFQRAEASRFCRGGGANGWKADFDFLTTESGLVKVLEGKYDNADKPSDTPPDAPMRRKCEWL